MKRNTAKEKAKRNKGFPYKSNRGLGVFVNYRDTYIIVLKQSGKVLERCRLKLTARARLCYWRELLKEEVEVRKS